MTKRQTTSLPFRRMLRVAVAAAAGLLGLHAVAPAHADGPCRSAHFEDMGYVVCSFDPAEAQLRLFWRDESGRPYRTFSALAGALDRQGTKLTFAMNAGMFLPDFTPLGLHVEEGRELRPVEAAAAPADVHPVPNFYKKPNGVFYIDGGSAGVLTTERFLSLRPKADYATQSGPMLVVNGRLHPAFIEGSRDRTRRTGVGVSASGSVHFAISDSPVNFYDFARLFRDRLGCRNALFLDGGRGTGLYSPELGRNDWSWHGGFGPIVGAVEQR
ncbi:phosphodiester glycosidase family protein [Mesorhizobium sp. BAC0120]|uniref:phosphodiester glycosidase family protein n=1 Tax=Mesorhizobium sp. BAC0120 TaxID=3090670 RepID=UPI00298D3A44|nr:phosphodiester glycosidase family protein [Mesorhizobium sp. BAC0120]MDW6022509.1 phosphodiester glycosidase family protein [Mesorhizobium sp. BAC0120]